MSKQKNYTASVGLPIEEDQKAKLNEIARQLRSSTSAVVRQAIAQFIANFNKSK